MDEIQKNKIFDLRMQGLGYKKIAKEMDMSADSIKTFCRRNNLKGHGEFVKHNYQEAKEIDVICKYCNKRIKKKIKGRSKKFCSDYCRRKWWIKYPEKRNKKAMYKFTCANCGSEFSTYGNRKRKFCSKKCFTKFRFYKGENNGIKTS